MKSPELTMFQIKLYKLFRILFTVALLGTIIQICVVFYHDDDGDSIREDASIILWWTPFGSEDNYRTCGNVSCFFTQNRSYVNDSRVKVILYYGSDVKIDDLPIPRFSDVRWGLLHEESPKNNLMFVHDDAINMFNYSATFSRYSDVPLTIVDLPGIKELSGTTFFRPTREKNRLMEEKKLAPVLYIQSNCDTLNDRDSYISELMKYIPVDSYGDCINNRQLPNNLKENYINQLSNNEFFEFVAQYKFTLAFENAVCDDYITEKLWRPLIVGSVPVYYGSPSFKDWLPNDVSAIAINDFEGPHDLAEYILELVKDDEKYEHYLKHKLHGDGINNNRLIQNLETRPKNLFSIFGYYVREFECFACRESYRNDVRIMTKKQYNCVKPMNIWKKDNTGDSENLWTSIWEQEACTAKLLSHALSNDEKINISKFHVDKMKMYESKKCF